MKRPLRKAHPGMAFLESQGKYPYCYPTSSRYLQICSYAKQKMVKILVGPSQDEYYFHLDLLREKCPFFAAALKPDWNHGKDFYHLESVKPVDFDVVAYWIYRDALPDDIMDHAEPSVAESDDEDDDMEDDNNDDHRALFSIRSPVLHKLADFLQMPDLQNALIDEELRSLTKHESNKGAAGANSLTVPFPTTPQ